MIEPVAQSKWIHGTEHITAERPSMDRDILAHTLRLKRAGGEPSDATRTLAAGERQILARERAIALAASGGSTSTRYTYKVAPDGRSYIVAAEVTVTGSRETLDAVAGGGPAMKGNTFAKGTGKSRHTGPLSSSIFSDRSEKQRDEVAELQRIEREVIAHEAAHKAAAGRLGGAVSYTYTTGPDGRRYITGGHVPIHTPATSDPEEALRNAETVMRAALSPGDPSAQDLAVAARAASRAASARAKILARSLAKTNETNRETRFDITA